MADITIVNGVYKPTYNWGAPSSMVSSPSGCTIPGMHIRDSGLRTSWIIMSCQTLRSFQLRLSIMCFGHVWMVGHVTQNFRHWKLDLPHQSILAFFVISTQAGFNFNDNLAAFEADPRLVPWEMSQIIGRGAPTRNTWNSTSENGDNDKTQKKKGRY